eukprot:COSAG04_NODE_809_length_10142_cov_3.378174_5_plen_219_part_00
MRQAPCARLRAAVSSASEPPQLTRSRGAGQSTGPADDVVAEIEAMGGEAMSNYGDVSSWSDCEAMIKATLDRFGDLHALVCNAGVLRDRSLINMSEDDWDTVFNVHAKGTFCPVRHAAAYWRDKSKEFGGPVEARVVVTSSVAGMYGNRGQANYGPAKASIAMFGISAAEELERYGVQVNVICPVALCEPPCSNRLPAARAAAQCLTQQSSACCVQHG